MGKIVLPGVGYTVHFPDGTTPYVVKDPPDVFRGQVRFGLGNGSWIQPIIEADGLPVGVEGVFTDLSCLTVTTLDHAPDCALFMRFAKATVGWRLKVPPKVGMNGIQFADGSYVGNFNPHNPLVCFRVMGIGGITLNRDSIKKPAYTRL